MTNTDIGNAMKFSNTLQTVLSRFLEIVKLDTRKINNSIPMTINYKRVLSHIVKIFSNKTEVVAQISCIWTAFITNYFRILVFPPISQNGDKWKFAKFQTLVVLAMIFYTDVVCLQIELLGYYAFINKDSQDLIQVCKTVKLNTVWLTYVKIVDTSVEKIVNNSKLAKRINELISVSNLLPVINVPLSIKSSVPSRLYNFYIRTVLSEWVIGGSMRSLVAQNWFIMNEEEYAVIYFQYLYTMYVIQKKYPGFSHNDGHLDNILIAYDAIPQKWPLVVNCDKYKVTTLKVHDIYAVEMKPKSGPSIRFTSRGKGPFKVKRDSTYMEYRLLGKSCYIPNVGYSVRLWDFDWANISSAKTQNEKVLLHGYKNSIFSDAGEYYDIYLFFQQMLSMRETNNSNAFNLRENCSNSYDLLFPSNIQKFHTRVLKDNKCVRATYENQRLTDSNNRNKYPTIAEIIDNELKNGIFKRFLTKPSRAKLANIYNS
jgi:hypothetical protein